jgi:4'-phosphopantetheinyl transferase
VRLSGDATTIPEVRSQRVSVSLEPRSLGAVSDVSLWWAWLDDSASSRRALAACLSARERDRAGGFRQARDRDRFVAARGWLRHLLAEQLRCTPGEVPIVETGRRKPELAGSDVRFSASRSAGIAVYATSRTIEVGVDVEAIVESVDVGRIAARFFSEAEQRALGSLPPNRRRVASFECWTRKEAYVKGTGAGLALPLRSFDVWPGDGARVTVSGWSLHSVDVAPGFAAAVAAADLDGSISVPRQLGAPSADRRRPSRSVAR